MALTGDPTDDYLDLLMAGDAAGLRALFAGEPAVDDPLGGHVEGAEAFSRFVAERQAWLRERSARREPLRTTRNAERTVSENLVHLRLPQGLWALPLAVVGVHASGG